MESAYADNVRKSGSCSASRNKNSGGGIEIGVAGGKPMTFAGVALAGADVIFDRLFFPGFLEGFFFMSRTLRYISIMSNAKNDIELIEHRAKFRLPQLF